jgi:hypothetical protein
MYKNFSLLVIRKGTDDSIAATIGTVDVSTITTSDAVYTFTNTSNSYQIAAGDKLLIEHRVGKNFSFLIKELFRYILEEIFQRKSDFTVTDNTVMFRFRDS